MAIVLGYSSCLADQTLYLLLKLTRVGHLAPSHRGGRRLPAKPETQNPLAVTAILLSM